MSIYAEVKDAKKNGASINTRGFCHFLEQVTFPIEPPNISADQISQANKTKAQFKESMIGTTMKGVKRCIELHKFSVSNGYGRAEAQRDFMLQHVALPSDLSMDVRAARKCPIHSNGVV